MKTKMQWVLTAVAAATVGCGDDQGENADPTSSGSSTTQSSPTSTSDASAAVSSSRDGGDSTQGSDTTGVEPSLTPEDKAVLLIGAFETGDPAALDVVADAYTQHNLGFPDGKQALEGFFTGSPTGITVTTHRVFSDGDFVFMHNEYGGAWNEGTPQVAFDVFRFEDGLIVEHWDNLADVADDEDGTSQVDGVVESSDVADTEDNRAIITAALDVLFISGQWSRLETYFDLRGYTQHAVGFGPDGAGLEQLVSTLPEGTPFYASVEFVHVEGDMALTMSEGFPSRDTGLSEAYFDLFRLDDGRVVEHWDVVQTIPAPETWANENGKW